MKTRVFSVFVLFVAFGAFTVLAQSSKTKPAAQQPKAGKPASTPVPASQKPVALPKAVVAKDAFAGPAPAAQSAPAAGIEQAVLEEINLARKNPEKYVEILENYKKLFKGKTIYFPNFTRVQTEEGIAAVDEAINALKKSSPVAPYSWSNGLQKAAELQLKDLVIDSSIAHIGKDGSMPSKRMGKYGTLTGRSGENISYFYNDARNIVLSWIIDDGVPNRGHRLNALSPFFKSVGIAFSKGGKNEYICIIDFADGFIELGAKPAGAIKL